MGFISSLVFKTKLLRSDSKHSPLEANMVCPVSSSSLSAYGTADLQPSSVVVSKQESDMANRWQEHLFEK